LIEPKHVLLIDDNEVDNFINRKVLSKSGLVEKITTETSAVSALEYLKRHANVPAMLPDVIFLDISMPQMDGFAFLKEFDTLPARVRDNCHIIMLTSSEDANDRAKVKHNPCVKNYLQKPLSSYMIEEIFE